MSEIVESAPSPLPAPAPARLENGEPHAPSAFPAPSSYSGGPHGHPPILTPPQSLDGHGHGRWQGHGIGRASEEEAELEAEAEAEAEVYRSKSTRRGGPVRGRPLIFVAEEEEGPPATQMPMRRGPLIFAAMEAQAGAQAEAEAASGKLASAELEQAYTPLSPTSNGGHEREREHGYGHSRGQQQTSHAPASRQGHPPVPMPGQAGIGRVPEEQEEEKKVDSRANDIERIIGAHLPRTQPAPPPAGDAPQVRPRKQSRHAPSEAGSDAASVSSHARRRALSKSRPVTPQSPKAGPRHVGAADAGISQVHDVRGSLTMPLDVDPFARTEPIQVVVAAGAAASHKDKAVRQERPGTSGEERPLDAGEQRPGTARSEATAKDDAPSAHAANQPLTPPSPEQYSRARSRRRGNALEKTLPAEVSDVAKATLPTFYYPLARHLLEPALLAGVLAYLSFGEWIALWITSKEIRSAVDDRAELREAVLERYLGAVGYARWAGRAHEPLRLTLKELAAYMRGVGLPTYQYAQIAAAALAAPPAQAQTDLCHALKRLARAYTRVVLRLRAQAEDEAERISAARRALPSSGAGHVRSVGPPLAWDNGRAQPKRMFSRQSSRAPSPTSSAWSHHAPSQSNLSLAHYRDDGPPARGGAAAGAAFRSPLFRLRRAPLLRVFVPSPGGEWLSDASVQECEMELRKAGVVALLRPGDVVWDMAVGDEGNTGRLVWDGRFLIVSNC